MENKPMTGRTPSDALIELISTGRVIFLFLLIVSVMFITVHSSAEPGTKIEFLGVIKYQKSKPIVPTPRIQTPQFSNETTSYYFPKSAPIQRGSQDAIPILDGTLAVIPIWQRATGLIGDSVNAIRVASRRPDGVPKEIYRYDKGVKFWGDIWLEVEYRENFFAIQVVENKEKRGESFVSVKQIPRATLKLQKLQELSVHDDSAN